MDQLEQEKEQLSHAIETNALFAKMLQNHDRENKRLWISNIIAWAVVLALVAITIFTHANMQAAFNEAMTQALDAVAEMEVIAEETTTTQTVEGDSATINNVDGEQYNDSSCKNGGE